MPCYLCNDIEIREGDRGLYWDDAVFGTPEKPEFRALAAHLRCFMLSFTSEENRQKVEDFIAGLNN